MFRTFSAVLRRQPKLQCNVNACSPPRPRDIMQVEELREYFSEYALIKYRMLVEVRWLQALSENDAIPEVCFLCYCVGDTSPKLHGA